MTYTKTPSVRLGLSLLALLFVGCNDGHDQQALTAASEQQSLVGKWDAPTAHESLEFKQDGLAAWSVMDPIPQRTSPESTSQETKSSSI